MYIYHTGMPLVDVYVYVVICIWECPWLMYQRQSTETALLCVRFEVLWDVHTLPQP